MITHAIVNDSALLFPSVFSVRRTFFIYVHLSKENAQIIIRPLTVRLSNDEYRNDVIFLLFIFREPSYISWCFSKMEQLYNPFGINQFGYKLL